MIYEFYDRSTTGPIVNYFAQFLPGVKLINYETSNIYSGATKIFTFGYETDVFNLIIDKNNNISILDSQIPMTRSHKMNTFLQIMNDIHIKETGEIVGLVHLKQHLSSIARDTKINSILN